MRQSTTKHTRLTLSSLNSSLLLPNSEGDLILQDHGTDLQSDLSVILLLTCNNGQVQQKAMDTDLHLLWAAMVAEVTTTLPVTAKSYKNLPTKGLYRRIL
ncbi:hypothetical protein BDW22DRAFT_1433300 [Trametopsis cervina]|nr:hypothetical protein BDW22DRAFT_1433300 [Trametopsis cervina]